MILSLLAAIKTFSHRAEFSPRMAFSCARRLSNRAEASSRVLGSSVMVLPPGISVFLSFSFAPQAAMARTIITASSRVMSFLTFIFVSS